MYEIGVIGHFASDLPLHDGQTVKTRELFNYISSNYSSKIYKFDTHNVTKNIFKLVYGIKYLLKHSKKIIIIMSSRGYMITLPIILFFNIFYKRKIYDFVIGGFRQNHLKNNFFLQILAKKEDKIYLESEKLVNAYNKMGFTKAEYIPNFKKIEIYEDSKNYRINKVAKICTFSRVSETKGIEEAIEAVKIVNKKIGKDFYELDIYGKIDELYEEKFEKMKLDFPNFIKYAGVVDYKESSKILKNYFLLLFPTFHDGEGFPGTFIDAFAAGLPIIASDWNCNREIVNNEVTGRIHPVHDIKLLVDILYFYYQNPKLATNMREYCLNEARKYLPENALINFLNELDV